MGAQWRRKFKSRRRACFVSFRRYQKTEFSWQVRIQSCACRWTIFWVPCKSWSRKFGSANLLPLRPLRLHISSRFFPEPAMITISKPLWILAWLQAGVDWVSQRGRPFRAALFTSLKLWPPESWGRNYWGIIGVVLLCKLTTSQKKSEPIIQELERMRSVNRLSDLFGRSNFHEISSCKDLRGNRSATEALLSTWASTTANVQVGFWTSEASEASESASQHMTSPKHLTYLSPIRMLALFSSLDSSGRFATKSPRTKSNGFRLCLC